VNHLPATVYGMQITVSLRERFRAHSKGLASAALAILIAIIGAVAGVVATNTFGESSSFPFPEPSKVRIDAEASLINPLGAENGAEEYVCLVNVSEDLVNLTGWKLFDFEGKVNELSQFSLAPDLNVRVHPGGRESHDNTAHDLYGNEDSYRWNNEGDMATVYDAEGEQVFSQGFPARDDGEVSGSCGPPLHPQPLSSHSPPTRGSYENGAAVGDKDCTGFSTQAEAQMFFEEHGGPEQDPYGLDANGNGTACESNP
jgi:hypothetical protein